MQRKEKFKKILLFALLILLPLISMNGNTVNINRTPVLKITANNKEKNAIIDELQSEVKNYISGFYQKCPDVIPNTIVVVGLESDIDICFMLAQSQIETCFGKLGIGRANSRHSIFGIERTRYNTYHEAIRKYAVLLKSNYLVNGKNEQDLLKRYVNKSGHRYAANPRYEAELRGVYNKIKTSTRIDELQQKYKNTVN